MEASPFKRWPNWSEETIVHIRTCMEAFVREAIEAVGPGYQDWAETHHRQRTTNSALLNHATPRYFAFSNSLRLPCLLYTSPSPRD
eukprot:13829531-Alexandrium_andersonii.AAC.1